MEIATLIAALCDFGNCFHQLLKDDVQYVTTLGAIQIIRDTFLTPPHLTFCVKK